MLVAYFDVRALALLLAARPGARFVADRRAFATGSCSARSRSSSSAMPCPHGARDLGGEASGDGVELFVEAGRHATGEHGRGARGQEAVLALIDFRVNLDRRGA